MWVIRKYNWKEEEVILFHPGDWSHLEALSKHNDYLGETPASKPQPGTLLPGLKAIKASQTLRQPRLQFANLNSFKSVFPKTKARAISKIWDQSNLKDYSTQKNNYLSF